MPATSAWSPRQIDHETLEVQTWTCEMPVVRWQLLAWHWLRGRVRRGLLVHRATWGQGLETLGALTIRRRARRALARRRWLQVVLDVAGADFGTPLGPLGNAAGRSTRPSGLETGMVGDWSGWRGSFSLCYVMRCIAQRRLCRVRP